MVPEKILSSIATKATTTTKVASTGVVTLYSVPTAFATVSVYSPLSKTYNFKIREKTIMYSQLNVPTKDFSGKFSKLYTKSLSDNEIKNNAYKDLVRVYKDFLYVLNKR